MNEHDTHQHDQRPTSPDPAGERPEASRDRPEPVAATTPEAVRAAQVARNDRRRALVRGRGVEWVRPTDLVARHSANVAGRSLDFQAELARRTRTPLRIGMQAARDRARRLPPITAFGRRTVTTSAPIRPGVGMG